MAPTKPLVAQHMSSFFSVLNMPEDGIAVVTGKNLPSTRMAVWKLYTLSSSLYNG